MTALVGGAAVSKTSANVSNALLVQDQGKEVIHEVFMPVGGTGGVIIIDTKGMYCSSKSNTTPTYVGIFKGE
mgnify:CR=1 FL=1